MGKIIGLIALIIVLFFVGPWFVLMGWNAAREMWPTLPQATYWQAFWISNAISIMFKARMTTTNRS
jgi:hypothetical protein